MKQTLLRNSIILFIICFCSCGTLKKHVKKTETIEKKTEVTESVTTKTISEVVDTLISIKADTTITRAALDSLLKGFDKIEETDVATIRIHYDTVYKRIYVTTTIKEKTVPVHINKTTIENKSEKKTATSEKKTKEKDKEVKRTSWWPWFCLGFGCCLILILLLKFGYKYLKIYFPFLP